MQPLSRCVSASPLHCLPHCLPLKSDRESDLLIRFCYPAELIDRLCNNFIIDKLESNKFKQSFAKRQVCELLIESRMGYLEAKLSLESLICSTYPVR